MRYLAILLSIATVAAMPVQTERLDYAAIEQIRDEGLHRSQIMDTLFWLTDRYGPRLTGSPQILEASDWAMKRMTDWGLANVHREAWPFGKGWSLTRFSAHMIEPEIQPLIGFPKAWSVGTAGPVTAEVVRASIGTEADLLEYRGRLRGRIVLAQPAREVRMLEGPLILRMDEPMTREAETTPIPPERRARADAEALRPRFRERLQQFYKEEGVVAVLDRGSDSDMAAGGSDLSWQQQHTDGGTVFPGTVSRAAAPAGVPQITLAVEHYNRMVRLVEHGIPVRVELDLRVQFHDADGFNTIAEIPGTDLASEVVMLGAHFDSVNAATGATDNAAGSAAMMEAMRIIRAAGLRPRRTIRLGLWGGEEEGLLGSRAYVAAHFGDPQTMKLLPEHASLSGYFNLDNGTGRIRGIWLQGNLAARPIFEQWMAPLRDLGVTIIGPRPVSQTDHVSFDTVGLPGFQFVQDRLEYNSRTHHSNMDVYDRLQRDDLIQQAVVAASFAYEAAVRDEKLPRKPLPKPQNPRP